MGLKDRLDRLEAQAERQNVPTWAEYEAASERERLRTLVSAYSKLGDSPGSAPGQTLSEEDRELLEGDTPEQQARDRNVIERWERAQGVTDLIDAAAEEAE